jgi:hypothetical protein
MKQALTILFLAMLTYMGYGQDESTTAKYYHFNGNVSVTNNGFSFIPLFSLGKPAVVADLSLGGERFSFDPQFRFDLAGLKPWSFIFIWRYKLVQTDRFQLKLGAHLPAISFRNTTFESDGETVERLIPYRFLTPELTMGYSLTDHISLGTYYIYGLGLEKEDQTRQTHFLSFRVYFNRIHLTKQLYFNWNPQVYYLNMDGVDGYYTAQSISIGHEKIPVSVASTMNIKISSNIETKDFDWNISLVYAFSNRFTKN